MTSVGTSIKNDKRWKEKSSVSTIKSKKDRHILVEAKTKKKNKRTIIICTADRKRSGANYSWYSRRTKKWSKSFNYYLSGRWNQKEWSKLFNYPLSGRQNRRGGSNNRTMKTEWVEQIWKFSKIGKTNQITKPPFIPWLTKRPPSILRWTKRHPMPFILRLTKWLKIGI